MGLVYGLLERRKSPKCSQLAGKQELYITLAGLIPVPLPLTDGFWIMCSWQILSFSSCATSSAAAYTASPPLRPFTSAALMAVTSLAPHTLRIQSDTSMRDARRGPGAKGREQKLNLFWNGADPLMRHTGFYLDGVNSLQEFSQHFPT